MALELVVSRRAAREIERVVEWWAANRPAAPGAIRQDLEAAVNVLIAQPEIGARVEEASSPDVRRFHLDRIRYWATEYDGNRLELPCVWHSNRGSGPAL